MVHTSGLSANGDEIIGLLPKPIRWFVVQTSWVPQVHTEAIRCFFENGSQSGTDALIPADRRKGLRRLPSDPNTGMSLAL
jgi:hypothetical protein